MRYLLILIFLVSGGSHAGAQVRAKARVDSTHMLIGDQMRLYLDVAVPAGSSMPPIDLEKLSDDPVEFIGQSEWKDLKNGERFRKTLVFTVWDSGYHVVPPVPVVVSQNGILDSAFTNDIPMEVMAPSSPPQKEGQLEDIKDIIEEPKTWRDWLPVITGLGVVLLAGLLIYLAWKRKTKQEDMPAAPPPPPLPPHELAMKNLAILRSEKLWQNGEVKKYHSRLTHIVREYLEGRYGIQALEKTTDEILAQMRENDLGKDVTEKMTALLQTADLVKFAKAKPPADYHERAMGMAEDFIAETKKRDLGLGTGDLDDDAPNPESQIPNPESP